MDLAQMMSRHAGTGTVRWIGVRPDRRAPVVAHETCGITLNGVAGDRRQRPGKRAVSLIQWEHLPVISALSNHEEVDPALLRRNLAVAGLNLLALRKATFRVGSALLRGTGVCAPCSRMEEVLGPGGYNAMRGHGGITAEVLEPGNVAIGDPVQPVG